MKKLLSVILAVMLVITACPIVALADEHTVRTEALILGSESISNEQEGWSYDADHHLLTLDNVTIDCSAAESDGNCITATEDLFIMLKGENTFKSKTALTINEVQASVIKYSGELAFNGTGTLNIIEGNYSLESTSSENRLIFYGGTINITHNLNNPSINENSNATLCGNNNLKTYISGGMVNSDVIFTLKQINSGSINSYIVRSQSDLEIKGGEVNAALMFAIDLTINGGSVAIIGGDTKIVASQFLTDSDRMGIVAINSFKMNGGSVYTHGSACALTSLNCEFNGGSFVAASEGIAVAAAGKSDDDAQLKISKSVQVDEPEDYQIKSFTYEDISLFITPFAMGDNNPESQTQTYYIKSVFDSSVQTPSFDVDEEYTSVTTNAAKRVEISERSFPDNIVLDRNGGTWADCFEEQGADELESGVYGKTANGWRYDTATNTLYLNNTVIDSSAADSDGNCIYAADDLNIVLEGESTLISKTEYYDMQTRYIPIKVDGNLTISGSGILNVKEGNIALDTTSNDYSITINGGIINFDHVFSSNIDKETANGFMLFNFITNTIINDGEINSDVSLFTKEINGGTVNAYSVGNNKELTVNGGEVNTNILFACGITINGGKVNASGGVISLYAKDYLNGLTDIGILSAGPFEMNGGDVNVSGSLAGLAATPDIDFNGGNFVAQSEGDAIVAFANQGEEVSINFANTVKVEEPASYTLNSFDINVANSSDDASGASVQTHKSVWDASVEEPYYEYSNAAGLNTNAAKRVVIKEYWDYSISADIESLDFGTVCYDSKDKTYVPAAVEVTLTNTGNRPVYIHPWSYPASDNAFAFMRQSDFPESKSLQPGESITYSVKPREELKPGNYEGYIEFPTSPRMFSSYQYRLQIPVSYVVNNHEYGEYVSNNDATYDSDGTKTHVCALCGKKQTVRDKGTKLIRNGWFNIENAWYYYIEDEAQTGWVLSPGSGKWFYLDENGVMQTGWIKSEGSGQWFYLKASGAMATGWQKVNGNWYYLKSSGAMATGWIKDGGKWYYLKSSGAMATGWLKDGGKWYYLNSSGAMVTGRQTINGKTYTFNSSGALL